jgi:hypothetical protein
MGEIALSGTGYPQETFGMKRQNQVLGRLVSSFGETQGKKSSFGETTFKLWGDDFQVLRRLESSFGETTFKRWGDEKRRSA